MARGLALLGEDLVVVVNVGDDQAVHGLHVAPDLDTVIYTLAGVEGPAGWGRAKDTFHFNDELARFGIDNRFRLGDTDLALKLYRTMRLEEGAPLSTIAGEIASAFGLQAAVVPASDDPSPTEVRIDEGWIGFQEYFVLRAHRDEVRELRFPGADRAVPASGVVEAVRGADLVVLGPSNPPLSIWPILAIGDIRAAVEDHPRVVCVSPLIGGKALKGPADSVMASLGLPPGNEGVAASYEGLIDKLVVHHSDAEASSRIPGLEVVASDTMIAEPSAAGRLAELVASL